MYLWMKVSKDEFEYPEIIADTQKELAMLCGVKRETISTAIKKAKMKGYKSQYVKVEISDD